MPKITLKISNIGQEISTIYISLTRLDLIYLQHTAIRNMCALFYKETFKAEIQPYVV